jgi:hypothetical protein
MKTTITLKPKMRMTSRAIEALVKSTGISYETSTEKSGNKYGFVDVIWCNGYKFKSAKAFGNYLMDIAGTLIDCGVASKELIEDAHMAGHTTTKFFDIATEA